LGFGFGAWGFSSPSTVNQQTGQVRLRLGYEGTDNAFAHDFAIERRKVE